MYRNSVSLIGFAGKDAEARSTKTQKPYTVLSLATQPQLTLASPCVYSARPPALDWEHTAWPKTTTEHDRVRSLKDL